MLSIEETYTFQKVLSSAQTFPVIGPLCVSPIKASLSLAQVVAAVAATVFFVCTAFLSQSLYLIDVSGSCFECAKEGAASLVYSVLNIPGVNYVIRVAFLKKQ